MPLTRARLKISDYNTSRKKRLSNQEKKTRMVSLSLTSMVDVFAILVIFLLTNTSTVSQWIEVGHNITLPKAKFSDPPPKATTLQIAADAVYADGKAVESMARVKQGATGGIKSWLKQQSKKEGYVNIVAHHKLPFATIKRVVAACQDAGFSNINLAVQPK